MGETVMTTVSGNIHLRLAPERTWLPLVFLQASAGLSEDEALEQVETGAVHPSVNIGRAQCRREIRVARSALLAYSPGQPRARLSLDTVITESFPACLSLAKSATIRGPDLRVRLSCSAEHLVHLLQDGELLQASKKGRYLTPAIHFASVVAWLKARVLWGTPC
jgi:hypothetical protein